MARIAILIANSLSFIVDKILRFAIKRFEIKTSNKSLNNTLVRFTKVLKKCNCCLKLKKKLKKT